LGTAGFSGMAASTYRKVVAIKWSLEHQQQQKATNKQKIKTTVSLSGSLGIGIGASGIVDIVLDMSVLM